MCEKTAVGLKRAKRGEKQEAWVKKVWGASLVKRWRGKLRTQKINWVKLKRIFFKISYHLMIECIGHKSFYCFYRKLFPWKCLQIKLNTLTNRKLCVLHFWVVWNTQKFIRLIITEQSATCIGFLGTVFKFMLPFISNHQDDFLKKKKIPIVIERFELYCCFN